MVLLAIEVFILTIAFKTIEEVRIGIASRFKARRLAMNMPQRELASRAGVAWSSLKRFEREGLVSLDSLLSLAMVLDCLDDFDKLASESLPNQVPQSLDALLEIRKPRRRATGKQGRDRGI
jgi:transcriptional regulator with XRE-family HTH domain